MTGPQIAAVGDRRPEIAESAFVAPGAHVLGDVTIGPESSVWYTSVLRGDAEAISVGAGSNIQDGCVLHADPGFPCSVGDRVTVGHRAVLHGCIISDDVLIGMSATVLNGATIGSWSLVAAGAVVLGGTEIPEGSLVAGVPAKVVRELNDLERANLAFSAQHYVAMASDHAAIT